MKYVILQIHKWLGIVSGLVVFIVSITGAMFTFQDEIKDALYDYRKVEVQEKSFLQPSEIYTSVQSKHKDLQVKRIMYFSKDRSSVIMLADDKKNYFMLYINPYTGKELHLENFKNDAFIVIQYIHTTLLLGKIGKEIVAISTIIFIILLITGLVLWWPNKKNQRKGAFNIKWGAKWKRVNYDLHNVLGFYTFAIVLIICLTGLSFSYPALRNTYQNIVNFGQTNDKESKKNMIDPPIDKKIDAFGNLDKAYHYAKSKSPKAAMYWIYLAESEKNPLSIRAYHESLQYYAMDFYQFENTSEGKPDQLMYSDLSAGKKLSTAMYDIHTGLILGLFGKIIAFIISLIAASLPITGILIWLNKGKKKEKKHHRKNKLITAKIS
ncbi:PepSY-associated TM helix domain-containing protein [Epilithonimonas hominis]|uniref:PepSY-associated TM helix domain-containing protein n=1 Tax=Epilithonimonas hominis TaxID=420404 RepID=UPI0028A01398|nr:PepSY-associated TM helix domain-containing protein [Epilithonimonas hominis]